MVVTFLLVPRVIYADARHPYVAVERTQCWEVEQEFYCTCAKTAALLNGRVRFKPLTMSKARLRTLPLDFDLVAGSKSRGNTV